VLRATTDTPTKMLIFISPPIGSSFGSWPLSLPPVANRGEL